MHHFRKTRTTYVRNRKHDANTGDCSFCSDKSLDKLVVKSTKTMQVFPNRTKYDLFEGLRVEDHLLVIPKRHVETIADFTQQEKLEMMEIAGEYENKGYSVYARGVGSIHRSVKHQHTHLVKLKNSAAKAIFYVNRPYILFHK